MVHESSESPKTSGPLRPGERFSPRAMHIPEAMSSSAHTLHPSSQVDCWAGVRTSKEMTYATRSVERMAKPIHTFREIRSKRSWFGGPSITGVKVVTSLSVGTRVWT
jgi:hypothetical protein